MPSRRDVLGLSLAVFGLAGCQQPTGTSTTDGRTASPEGRRSAGATSDTSDGSGTTTTDEAGTTTTDGDGAVAPVVRLEPVSTRPVMPVAFAETPTGAFYVADRPGRVHRLDGDETETALNLTDTVVTGGERGLLGLALHPEFEANDRLYLRYSVPPRSGTPPSYSHTFVLAEFRARPDGTIDRRSERTVLEIPEPQSNHNSGPTAFGPDGYLYVGVGDGGASGDRGPGHAEDWYDANPGGNGQDVTENLLGSVLRIDVDERSGDRPYGIPDDNPLVDETGRDEHYAWGFRNPWGISFDGSDLYVADVGQNRYEEVNRVRRGGNYGWNVSEGAHCFRSNTCPSTGPDGTPLRDPVIEYPHDGGAVSGVSVVGGHVYRGDALPALAGRYVFGDLNAQGRLFVATPTPDGLWQTEELRTAVSSRDRLSRLFALGRDRADELYALTDGGVYGIQ